MYQGAYVHNEIEKINLAKNSFVEEGEKPSDHSSFMEDCKKHHEQFLEDTKESKSKAQKCYN